MHDDVSSNPPKTFYGISGIALAWNLYGVLAYLGQVTLSPETLAQMPEAQRALSENVPAWSTAAYATAVHAGALGCVLLLMRRSLALPVFFLSMAGVLVQMYHTYFMTNMVEVMGGAAAVLSTVIILVGAYLIWFANDAKKKGWIR